MAVTVNTTQTKYFSNIGPSGNSISFSTIASTLGQDSSRNVRFGSYIRKTDANEVFVDPSASEAEKALATAIVPDAIENRTSGVDGNGIASSQQNHKISSLKNMILRYDVSVSGSNDGELNISGGGVILDNWNSNLDLNVPKKVTFDNGSLRASSTSAYALKFDDQALNLDLTFSGTKVLGAHGTGGTAQTDAVSATNGSSGGSALYLRNRTIRSSLTASTINFNLSNNALIAGGGGGGAGGAKGTVSGRTRCTYTKNYSQTKNSGWSSNCPVSCTTGLLNACNTNQDCTYFRGTSGYSRGTCYYSSWTVNCTETNTRDNGVIGSSAGGNGGVGQGANNTSANSINPGAPGAAASLNCPNIENYTMNQPGTSSSTEGKNGGTGGTYGQPGENTTVANGGGAGPWLTVASLTRYANKGASGTLVQKVNIATF